MDYKQLIAPIADDAPCGVNLRNDPELRLFYQSMRDARSSARTEDRTSENPSAIDRQAFTATPTDQAALSPHWRETHDLCWRALTEFTKDIEVFSWLIEAVARIAGFAALAAVFEALSFFCESHFDQLYSLDMEPPGEKAAPLTGLNGAQGYEGTLIRPLRLASLLPEQPYGKFSYWNFEQAYEAQSGEAWKLWRDKLNEIDPDLYAAEKMGLTACLTAINRLDAALLGQCGADSPSFSKIRDVLDSIRSAYERMTPFVRPPTQTSIADAPNERHTGHPEQAHEITNHAPLTLQAVMTRESAFEALLQIADFFRKTEPHSIMSNALETIVTRGRMDFLHLLEELIPSEDQRRDLLTRAGVRVQTEKDKPK